MDNLEIERKWVLKRTPTTTPDESWLIHQWYNGDTRYRRSINNATGDIKFEVIRKTLVSPGVNMESTVPMSGDKMMEKINSTLRSTKKRRDIYFRNGMKIEVDTFTNIALVMMEVEFENESDLNKDITFPAFIQDLIITEVTGNKAYSNFNLAEAQFNF